MGISVGLIEGAAAVEGAIRRTSQDSGPGGVAPPGVAPTCAWSRCESDQGHWARPDSLTLDSPSVTSAIGSTGHQIADEHREAADRALEILLDPALEPIVDMVLTRRDGRYEALAAGGSVTFERTEEGGFVEVASTGRNPLADQSTDKFVGLESERAELHPHRHANVYPFAYAQTAQLFDSPAAPDLCVLHSASHNWEDQGGHLGEHGSLGIVQARAPMVIGGKGVRSLGVIPRVARLVDTAPTIAALLGCAPRADGTYLAVQDGEPLLDVLDPTERPDHVVGLSVRRDQLQRALRPGRTRRAPPTWRGSWRWVTALGHGAMSSLPTVTLANHTRSSPGPIPAITASSTTPGGTGSTGEQVITNSQATWP